jgi:hypothetical protein
MIKEEDFIRAAFLRWSRILDTLRSAVHEAIGDRASIRVELARRSGTHAASLMAGNARGTRMSLRN